ncbi:MAG: hypothetical protein PHP82_02965 [Candidatus ainarchaeum sp.]|nr:hypothetical protein [Candidatus ainarchaeum sp.]
MQKGQVAIEFIFIILIIVIYLFGVTKPILENAQGVIEDIENISKANYATQQLADTTNKISLLGVGSKETITLFIPKNAKILCNDFNFGFEVEINKTGNNTTVSICEENICKKEFKIREGIELDCMDQNFLYGIVKIVITKQDDTISIFEGR